jgi:hypothetical protein
MTETIEQSKENFAYYEKYHLALIEEQKRFEITEKTNYSTFDRFEGKSAKDAYNILMPAINSFKQLDNNLQIRLIAFIEANYRKRVTVNKERNSYGMKHDFEKWRLGDYVDNDQFKGAMLVCGFSPSNIDDINWNFNVQFHKKNYYNLHQR